MVHEDKLEEEVEVTDTIRERIELTIIELDSAIKRSAETPRDHRAVRSELPDGDHSPQLPCNTQGPEMQEHEEDIEQPDPSRLVRSGNGESLPPAPPEHLLAAMEVTTALQTQAFITPDTSLATQSENRLVFHSTHVILPKLSLKERGDSLGHI